MWLLGGAVCMVVGLLMVFLIHHPDYYYSAAWKIGGCVVFVIGLVVIIVAMAHGDHWSDVVQLFRWHRAV